MLWAELRVSARTINALNSSAISPTLLHAFNKLSNLALLLISWVRLQDTELSSFPNVVFMSLKSSAKESPWGQAQALNFSKILSISISLLYLSLSLCVGLVFVLSIHLLSHCFCFVHCSFHILLLFLRQEFTVQHRLLYNLLCSPDWHLSYVYDILALASQVLEIEIWVIGLTLNILLMGRLEHRFFSCY